MKLTKRILSLILCAVLALPVFVAAAPEAEASTNNNGWVIERASRSERFAYYRGNAAKVTVPSGVTSVFYLSKSVREVHLSASVTEFTIGYSGENLEKITVHRNNTRLFARAGVLYSKSSSRGSTWTILEHYPAAKRDRTYSVLSGTWSIETMMNDHLRTLHLPNSLQNIIAQTFGGRRLKDITVGSRNRVFSVKNGVLYREGRALLSNGQDRTGSILVYYPGGRTNRTFTVPKGTLTIENITNSHLRTLRLPTSLLSIDYINARRLTGLHIPRNIHSPGRIKVGGGVTIADRNRHLTMSGGVIFSKDMTELIYYPPTKRNRTYTVPRGVKRLSGSAFMDNTRLRTLRLRPSVEYVGLRSPSIETLYLSSNVSIVSTNILNAPRLRNIYVKRNSTSHQTIRDLELGLRIRFY